METIYKTAHGNYKIITVLIFAISKRTHILTTETGARDVGNMERHGADAY